MRTVFAFVCSLALSVFGAVATLSASDTAQPAKAGPPTLDASKPADYPGVHNAVAYHDGFVSGSVPEGDAGFDTLAAWGVKTIISVDGAAPDVARAEARGMRYIHLPIGYNGFDDARKRELVRATRDAMGDGPVHIHCHHGKHRSAGAAAAIAASLGWATPEAGVERMKVSGTAPNYKGLYACAQGAAPLTEGEIDSVAPKFPSVARPSDFVRAMVEIDEALEHLKEIEAAGWAAPPDHPDLVPAAEAGRLADLLRLMTDDERTKREPAGFAALMLENQRRASALEELLADRPAPDAAKARAAALSAQFKLVAASCKDCHAKHRD